MYLSYMLYNHIKFYISQMCLIMITSSFTKTQVWKVTSLSEVNNLYQYYHETRSVQNKAKFSEIQVFKARFPFARILDYALFQLALSSKELYWSLWKSRILWFMCSLSRVTDRQTENRMPPAIIRKDFSRKQADSRTYQDLYEPCMTCMDGWK